MRLQLGKLLSSFLVVVGVGHGSIEVVLLVTGIFRGRPVCGSGIPSLLPSVEGLRKEKETWLWLLVLNVIMRG